MALSTVRTGSLTEASVGGGAAGRVDGGGGRRSVDVSRRRSAAGSGRGYDLVADVGQPSRQVVDHLHRLGNAFGQGDPECESDLLADRVGGWDGIELLHGRRAQVERGGGRAGVVVGGHPGTLPLACGGGAAGGYRRAA